MAYNWSEAAEGGGAGDKIEPGIHRVTGSKVVRGSAKGDFTSKKGDPQIMLVVENEEGAEAAVMFTLSEKAGWTLARWLSRCGVDLKQMEKEGVDITHFANEDIAEQWLVGKSLWVRVSLGSDPKYRNLEPMKEEEARMEAPEKFSAGEDSPPDLKLDQIPFAILIALPSLGWMLA